MRHSEGQTLVLVALMMMVLLGLVALGIDGGNAYLQRRQMQTAADAGALAAARTLCMGAGAIYAQTAGNDYCAANGAASCTTILSGSGALVEASITYHTWFAGVVGVSNLTVGAVAEAQCSALGGIDHLLPFAVQPPLGGFRPGDPVVLWDNKKSSPDGTGGAYGFLIWELPDLDEGQMEIRCGDDGCAKCPNIDSRMEPPLDCAPYIMVGDMVRSEQGSGLGSLLASYKNWSPSECTSDKPKTPTLCWMGQEVVVPFYDYMDDTHYSPPAYHITGFGKFVFTDICVGTKPKDHFSIRCGAENSYNCENYTGELDLICTSTNDKIVRGYFVEEVLGGGAGNPTAPNYGLTTVHLLH